MPFYDLDAAALDSYRSAVAAPSDFDVFWHDTLEDVRRTPLGASFTPIDYGLPLFDIFDVTFSGFGAHPVKAWLIRPSARGVRAESCVVSFIGYGGGRGFPHEHLLWPSTGRSALIMDTRGQGSSHSHGATADPVGSDPALAGFMTRGIGAPATYFYRRVFSDAVRAVETARAYEGIDPDRIVVTGGSQGGGIALAVAGLDPKLKAVMVDVPFLCDFPRAVGLAQRDPYNEITRYLSVHRAGAESVFRTLSYFDGVNFSRRAKAPALFSVALMDAVCPPSTVYGAYHAYGGDKSIESYTFNDHEGGGPFQEQRQIAWLARQG
jgi:cephalosporin-C deacetylase